MRGNQPYFHIPENDDEQCHGAPKIYFWVWKADRIGVLAVAMETGFGKSVRLYVDSFLLTLSTSGQLSVTDIYHFLMSWKFYCSFLLFRWMLTAASDPSWYFGFSCLAHYLIWTGPTGIHFTQTKDHMYDHTTLPYTSMSEMSPLYPPAVHVGLVFF